MDVVLVSWDSSWCQGGEVKKLKHGEKCEQKLAPADLERAPVVEPKEPMKNPAGGPQSGDALGDVSRMLRGPSRHESSLKTKQNWENRVQSVQCMFGH